MSITAKALGAFGSPASDEIEAEAAKRALWAAAPGDWLTLALDHHNAIRKGFETCRATIGGPARLAESRRLARVLNGHAIAEELVLYPTLAQSGDKLPAGQAYVEHTAVKLQMAELERIDPSTNAWLRKLEHIHRAVRRHMYEEENGWFLDLKDKAQDQAYLTRRFREEFARYAGEGELSFAQAEPRSFNPTQLSAGELDRY